MVNVATIYGNTGTLAVSSVTTNVVANPINSGYIYKVNLLTVSNISTNSYAVSAELNVAGSNTFIIKGVSVPANSSLSIIARDTNLYLLENTCIQMSSTQNSALQAICSWEQIA